ncbi:hypothetical protein EZV62_007624 [Acer yangbiense]|uniref:Uncharacterized protein n=1 Tax=Acer yangbiense TaxID=1000413 RepID=A0A5C7IC12_9ROSI|nr:hypothetical protein EZV62_007624 [Acer yangbiense]
MGVMSRRVLPVCGNLCFFCPSLHARSRQPVKRYKKMLAELFPRNQDVEPNDRKIGKLCEYASKNPLRIPKITNYLEQRCYKDLQNEHFGSVKVVVCIYKKLLSSCKEQMPLFASSLLIIVLVDFINSQVWFMGEQSHISMDFDNIISVTLENYMGLQMKSENGKEGRQNSQSNDQSFQNPLSNNDLDSTMDTSKSPSYWSWMCLKNIAGLAKEASTVRHVLEPLLNNFDAENHWSAERGVACSVLVYLQSLLEESGENSHLLLSVLIKQLDHKNVAKQLLVQAYIVNVATQLAQSAKVDASVAVIGAITDLIKHLRKCLQNSAELSSPKADMAKWNGDLQYALENCILHLSKKLGMWDPFWIRWLGCWIVISRTAISAVHRTAQIISSIPAFPDALFHQLLQAMTHPDHETRVGAHSVFSVVLMPSLLSPWSNQNKNISQAVSGFLRASQKLTSFQLSSHQVSLLLPISGFRLHLLKIALQILKRWLTLIIWLCYLPDLSSELCIRTGPITQTSSHIALVRCFQLAFSLWSISLDQEGGLQPSCRRSLFTLASYMHIFWVRAGNLPELIPIFKSSLTKETVDPYLELIEDIRLQAICAESDKVKIAYGSQEDEVAAMKSLVAIESDDHHVKETVISHFMTKFEILSELEVAETIFPLSFCEGKRDKDELSSIKKQLSEGFSPDDAYPLEVPLFMETPRPCSPLAQIEFQAFDEVMPLAAFTDDEAFLEPSGSQSDRKTSLSINTLDILSVNEL